MKKGCVKNIQRDITTEERHGKGTYEGHIQEHSEEQKEGHMEGHTEERHTRDTWEKDI